MPPTGKYVEVPTVAIVCFRGDKLYHEHIYWDQASVLVQIGLLDPKGLPIAGRETADKVRESEPAVEHVNEMIPPLAAKPVGPKVTPFSPGDFPHAFPDACLFGLVDNRRRPRRRRRSDHGNRSSALLRRGRVSDHRPVRHPRHGRQDNAAGQGDRHVPVDADPSVPPDVAAGMVRPRQSAGHAQGHLGNDRLRRRARRFSYGYGLCGTVHAWNEPYWKALGMGARRRSFPGHTNSEIEYGGSWHTFDTDMAGLVFRKDGVVAGYEDIIKDITCLENDRSPLPCYPFAWPSDFNGMKQGWKQIAKGGNWYRMYNGGYAAQPGIVHLRSGETFTRYFDRDHFGGLAERRFWHNQKGGPFRDWTFVNMGTPEHRGGKSNSRGNASYCNGEFVYRPNLAARLPRRRRPADGQRRLRQRLAQAAGQGRCRRVGDVPALLALRDRRPARRWRQSDDRPGHRRFGRCRRNRRPGDDRSFHGPGPDLEGRRRSERASSART